MNLSMAARGTSWVLARVSLALFLGAFALPARAQVATGSIAGNVLDATGAAVRGATITVRNSDVSTERTVLSDGAGSFGVTGLVPGTYLVKATRISLYCAAPARHPRAWRQNESYPDVADSAP